MGSEMCIRDRARSIPYDDEERTWTVVCLAKKPGQTGIHVVGWFERAYLLGQSFDRPEYDIGGFRVSSEGSRFTYSIKSDHAYLVHPNDRINPFSHSSVKTGKYSFLTLENEKNNKRKKEVLKILSSELKKLKSIAIKNPNTSNVEDFDNDEVDPVSGFGTPEHRKKVEKSAVKFVTNHLRKKGYNIISVEDQNCGYDLLASKGKSSLEVEVKGTAGSEERFFLTRNENFYMRNGNQNWRLAIVTNALSSDRSLIFSDAKQVIKKFTFEPLAFKCTPKSP